MLAPIIPIDAIDRALAQIVWRLPLELTAELDDIFQLEPVDRIKKLMEIITKAAKKDPKIIEILRTPELLPTLKQMAIDRQSEQSEQQSGQTYSA